MTKIKFSNNPLAIPLVLRTARLASVRGAMFGMTRNNGTRPHQGIDLAVNPNFRIRAVENGVIHDINTTNNNGHGLFVCLKMDCPDKPSLHNTFAFYSHLNRVDVRIGQHVKANDILGLTGYTGNAKNMRTIDTGSHLHFEIRLKHPAGLGLQNRIDPFPYLFF